MIRFIPGNCLFRTKWVIKMADIYDKRKRSEIMSRVKNKATAPEKAFESILLENQIKFEKNVSSIEGEPDFFLPHYKLAVFVHGCFWHGHKNCPRAKLPKANKHFWREKISLNMRRDQRIQRKLRSYGFHVMTVWQCRLKISNSVEKKLLSFIKKIKINK